MPGDILIVEDEPAIAYAQRTEGSASSMNHQDRYALSESEAPVREP